MFHGNSAMIMMTTMVMLIMVMIMMMMTTMVMLIMVMIIGMRLR